MYTIVKSRSAHGRGCAWPAPTLEAGTDKLFAKPAFSRHLQRGRRGLRDTKRWEGREEGVATA